MKDRAATNKMSYSSIAEGPFPDHSEGTHQIAIAESEAVTVLQNWCRVACYNLPDKEVAELLRHQANTLIQ